MINKVKQAIELFPNWIKCCFSLPGAEKSEEAPLGLLILLVAVIIITSDRLPEGRLWHGLLDWSRGGWGDPLHEHGSGGFLDSDGSSGLGSGIHRPAKRFILLINTA